MGLSRDGVAAGGGPGGICGEFGGVDVSAEKAGEGVSRGFILLELYKYGMKIADFE